MKARFNQVICIVALLAALALPSGCDHLDDDEQGTSGSILLVSGVVPNAVLADVTPSTDPNTLASIPPDDDNVIFTLSNSATLDILVLSFSVVCQNGTLNTTAQPLGVPVPTGGTASVPVTLATGAYKEANMAALLGIGADICRVRFTGETLSGDPVSSTEGLVGVTFVDAS